ncbi:aminotransferase class III-fold pyridoxal phosphate-dependent enzyme, partial [Streptomyces sp. NPDC127079]|uniref:aminotransferase class III-fold pyridoxal phosphate-dependent enzyme n=1 Tax=Streptomyces sp. NPDC127079 TaxID=3347132 RepID=UPI0036676FC5
MTALPQERRVVTAIPGPKSQELQTRRLAAVAQGVGSVLPVFTTRAGGGIIEDVDGNRLIDFGSGIAVTSVGASAEAVVRRASAQLADFTHTCFMVTPYEGYVEVAEALAELTPGDHAKKSALFNSGAEAVENAVKIARAYTKRQAVVVFDHGYHGRTNLTMALTSKNMPYKNGFGPFAPEVYRVPVAYAYRWPTGPQNAGPEAAKQAIDQISKQIGADNVAAIIIEPVLGEGGFIEPAKGFLPAISQFAKDNGIVFVADEIQSGLGRTGRTLAVDHEDVVPDVLLLGKALGGGIVPVSAVVARREVMSVLHPGEHGSTFGGNPLAAAVGTAVVELLESGEFQRRAAELGVVLRDGLAALVGRGVVGFRARGLWAGVDVDPAIGTGREISERLMREGVLVKDTHGSTIRLAPPLTVTADELRSALGSL